MLVNPVNCVGVMGAGLAKEFKFRYPGNYARYRVLCQAGRIQPGDVMYDDGDGQLIANAATKAHWRNPAKLDWVHQCVENLDRHTRIYSNQIGTVAMPLLGAGLGGLNPWTVKSVIRNGLHMSPAKVFLYVSDELA